MPQEVETQPQRRFEEIKRDLIARGEDPEVAERLAFSLAGAQRGARAPVTDIAGRPAARKTTGGRTRDELYDEARSLGIAGRSKMTKAELERAVDRRRGRI